MPHTEWDVRFHGESSFILHNNKVVKGLRSGKRMAEMELFLARIDNIRKRERKRTRLKLKDVYVEKSNLFAKSTTVDRLILGGPCELLIVLQSMSLYRSFSCLCSSLAFSYSKPFHII